MNVVDFLCGVLVGMFFVLVVAEYKDKQHSVAYRALNCECTKKRFQTSDRGTIMTLKEFLTLIQDEEARIELEIYDGTSDEYKYDNFWLSDYRSNLCDARHYKECLVDGISFCTNEKESDIVVYIKI